MAFFKILFFSACSDNNNWFCQQEGLCISNSTGYVTCDCSKTNFGGTYCDQGKYFNKYILLSLHNISCFLLRIPIAISLKLDLFCYMLCYGLVVMVGSIFNASFPCLPHSVSIDSSSSLNLEKLAYDS